MPYEYHQKARLIDGLMLQTAVNGDRELAHLIASKCSLRKYSLGDVLIEQGDHTDELLFILRGRVNVVIDGLSVGQRCAGQHVGEMAAIDPRAARSATVTAAEETEVAVLSERDHTGVATVKPEIWRNIARELGQRLREISPHTFADSQVGKAMALQMKKHLFYLFLAIFTCTAVLTLLGIANVITIDSLYLKGLYTTLLVELVGAVIGLFKVTKFFGDE